MLPSRLPIGLAVLLASSGLAFGAPVGRDDAAVRAGAADSARTLTACERPRFRADCPCGGCSSALEHRRNRMGWSSGEPSAHAGRVARDLAPALPRGANRARTLVARDHSSTCACSACGKRSHGHDGRGRRHGDGIVVLTGADGRSRGTLVLDDGDPTRILLSHVSVQPPVRDDGVLAISEGGGDVLVRGAAGTPVVLAGERPQARTGDGSASGELYLHVRADGRLEIRSR